MREIEIGSNLTAAIFIICVLIFLCNVGSCLIKEKEINAKVKMETNQ